MRLRLLTLSLGNFAIGTGSLVLAGILPLVADGLHVSMAAGGQLVTVYALFSTYCRPFAIYRNVHCLHIQRFAIGKNHPSE